MLKIEGNLHEIIQHRKNCNLRKKGTKKNSRQLISIFVHFPLQYTMFWILILFQKLNVISFYTSFKVHIQVNLCQKYLFLNQLTHNMTTDCPLITDFNTRKIQVENIVFVLALKTIFVHKMFSTCFFLVSTESSN